MLHLTQSTHVVVLAEGAVADRRVVGPSEQLGMGSLDVVALVEGVEHRLPVGREDHRAVGAEPHLLEAIRLEELGERSEERLERLTVGIHVDEDEPAPAAHLDLVQADVGVGHRRGEVEAVDHLLVGAVQLEPPGVVSAADLTGGEVPDSGGQPGAPMRTGVVERAYRRRARCG